MVKKKKRFCYYLMRSVHFLYNNFLLISLSSCLTNLVRILGDFSSILSSHSYRYLRFSRLDFLLVCVFPILNVELTRVFLIYRVYHRITICRKFQSITDEKENDGRNEQDKPVTRSHNRPNPAALAD